MDKMIHTRENKPGFSAYIFIIYCFFYISGYSSQGHNYITFALFSTWVVSAIIENINAFCRALSSRNVLWLMLFLLYYFLTSYFVSDFIYIFEYISVYLFLYGVYIQYRYYLIRNRIKEIKLIYRMILLAFVVFALNAIKFYISNPSAARTLAADFYAFDSIAIGGGYSIAFGSALLVSYLFELLLREEALRKKKILILLIIMLLGTLVIMTESTTTIIAMIIGMVYGWIRKIYYGKDTKKSIINSSRKIMLVLFIVIVAVLIIINISFIGKWIMEITSDGVDNVVVRRFNRIGEKFYYGGSGQTYDNYVDERFQTILLSISTFFNNPVFGVGYKCGNVFSELAKYGVGTHSELADIFAQFGLVGGGMWLAYFLSTIKKCGKFSKIKGYYLTLIILLIFNPFKAFHGYIILFFVIPAINYTISVGKEMNVHE